MERGLVPVAGPPELTDQEPSLPWPVSSDQQLHGLLARTRGPLVLLASIGPHVLDEADETVVVVILTNGYATPDMEAADLLTWHEDIINKNYRIKSSYVNHVHPAFS